MCLKREVCKKVSDEFYAYKNEVLKCNAEVVWNLSNRIAFFSCVAEYFEYSEDIPEEFLRVLNRYAHPIYTMWMEYLKNENLQYARWEDIEMILSQMAKKEEENYECSE